MTGVTGKPGGGMQRLVSRLVFAPLEAIGWAALAVLGFAIRLALFRAQRTQGITALLWGLGFATYLWAGVTALTLSEERAVPFAVAAGTLIALFVYLRGAALENPPASKPGVFQRRLIARWLQRRIVPSTIKEAEAAEQKRWLIWFGLPALVAAIFVAATFATGQEWYLGVAVAAVIMDIGLLIWLTLSTDMNASTGERFTPRH
jgi:hypothetical protein